jgi:hypothetical protein
MVEPIEASDSVICAKTITIGHVDIGRERLLPSFGFDDMLERVRQLHLCCAGATAVLDERFTQGVAKTDCVQVVFIQ